MIDLAVELDALLATWRARRTTATAQLIDELSSWVDLVLPDLDGKTRTQRHEAWLRRAQARSAIELPALLATVAQGTAAQTTEQLEVLADWPADPRTTRLARRMFDSPPFATSSGDQKVWRRLFDVIERHADPRVLPAIEAGRMKRIFRSGDRGLAMQARAAAVVTSIEGVDVTLSADERAAHAALTARLASALESGRMLRDAVRLDEDDAPSRLVYLDWLMERGYAPPR